MYKEIWGQCSSHNLCIIANKCKRPKCARTVSGPHDGTLVSGREESTREAKPYGLGELQKPHAKGQKPDTKS